MLHIQFSHIWSINKFLLAWFVFPSFLVMSFYLFMVNFLFKLAGNYSWLLKLLFISIHRYYWRTTMFPSSFIIVPNHVHCFLPPNANINLDFLSLVWRLLLRVQTSLNIVMPFPSSLNEGRPCLNLFKSIHCHYWRMTLFPSSPTKVIILDRVLDFFLLIQLSIWISCCWCRGYCSEFKDL